MVSHYTYLFLVAWPLLLPGAFGHDDTGSQSLPPAGSGGRCRMAVVILSQRHDQQLHTTTSENFEAQLGRNQQIDATVHFLHEKWPEVVGGWTIFPLFKRLLNLHGTKSWVVFCDSGTQTNITKLCDVLARHDSSKEWFLGRGIRDEEPTIVHHFAFHDDPTSFLYPDVAAGFVLSMSLLRKLEARRKDYVQGLDFSIDPQHELATFVWDGGAGTSLTDVPEFCIEPAPNCATHYVATKIKTCGRSPVMKSQVFFAVKTWRGNHDERVPVILNTWGKDVNLKLFSDTSDDSLPVVNLGLPNTKQGHCAKTFGILEHVANDEELGRYSWVVIVDDDTLLSVPRLLRLLSCYSPEERVALGERYGFRTASQQGYDYLTGGAGIVFSMTTVKLLVTNEQCRCARNDSPDDMTLGMCLEQMGIPIIHSPNFHQARPPDYSPHILLHQEPVSFHKFWMIDPVSIYKLWLHEKDRDGPSKKYDEL